jgi:hypothetical protein
MLMRRRPQKITTDELAKIRNLEPFDLIMLISEIHDHGWPIARETLRLMPVRSKKTGRPLAASAHQMKQVQQQREAGKSLRAIAADTGASLSTIRTITHKSVQPE